MTGTMARPLEAKLGLGLWIVFPPMDRTRARANITSGFKVGAIALLVFGLAFYVTILYLA